MESIEEKKVGIPESITINGVTYTVKDTPELQRFIQEVAKVEKSKLYTQFENLKTQIANLSKVEVTDNNTDANNLLGKLKDTFITKEDFKELLSNGLKEVVQPLLTANEQSRLDDLRQYREKLISDNEATCIPELVKGETKEELDNSLQESIRIRASYPTPSTAHVRGKVVDPLLQEQFRQEMTTVQTPTPSVMNGQSAPTPQPPVAPRRPSPEVSGPQNVKQMPMSEFEKRRDALKQQLEAMYGSGSL